MVPEFAVVDPPNMLDPPNAGWPPVAVLLPEFILRLLNNPVVCGCFGLEADDPNKGVGDCDTGTFGTEADPTMGAPPVLAGLGCPNMELEAAAGVTCFEGCCDGVGERDNGGIEARLNVGNGV